MAFDLETTGLDPKKGHRIIAVGAVELVDHIPTGNHFHAYINPRRSIDPEALKVHGLPSSFLRTQPVFAEVWPKLKEFIGDDPLVIHNAAFDLAFLKAEIDRLGETPSTPCIWRG